jgi:hypothetical protein
MVARWSICWVEKSDFLLVAHWKICVHPPPPNPGCIHGSIPKNLENNKTSFWIPKSPVTCTLRWRCNYNLGHILRARRTNYTSLVSFPAFMPQESIIQHKRNAGNIKIEVEVTLRLAVYRQLNSSWRQTLQDQDHSFFFDWALVVTVLMLTRREN